MAKVSKAKRKCTTACMRHSKNLIRAMGKLQAKLLEHVGTLHNMPHPDEELLDVEHTHEALCKEAMTSILVVEDHIKDMCAATDYIEDDTSNDSTTASEDEDGEGGDNAATGKR